MIFFLLKYTFKNQIKKREANKMNAKNPLSLKCSLDNIIQFNVYSHKTVSQYKAYFSSWYLY